MAREKQPSIVTRRWPCIFSEPLIREQVDPRVAAQWQAVFGKRAPFGDLRNSWRRHHCRTLNPYGSETCPYAVRDCALAFYAATKVVTGRIPPPDRPGGFFIKVAKGMGAARADNKPLARDRTMEHAAQGPSQPGAPATRVDPGSWVRGPEDRPFTIGDVLGSLNLRPREGSADDGKESPK